MDLTAEIQCSRAGCHLLQHCCYFRLHCPFPWGLYCVVKGCLSASLTWTHYIPPLVSTKNASRHWPCLLESEATHAHMCTRADLYTHALRITILATPYVLATSQVVRQAVGWGFGGSALWKKTVRNKSAVECHGFSLEAGFLVCSTAPQEHLSSGLQAARLIVYMWLYKSMDNIIYIKLKIYLWQIKEANDSLSNLLIPSSL